MRQSFIKVLTELARKDEKIFLLTGDLGFSVFEKFREEFPHRFLNIGVAEQNMIGIASGLALSGKIAFVYSIIPFLIMRPFEQIRLDICYQNVNVKIVGSGGGFAYGSAGCTHHATEDISIMRSLPNMTVICPADPVETELAIKCSVEYDGPVYIRIGREKQKIYYKEPEFKIGKGIIVREGDHITIISTGDMLKNVLEAARKLSEMNIDARIISMHTVKPIDAAVILKSANETKAIFTVEEHNIIGGLGSAVAEVLMESRCKNIIFRRIGIPDTFAKKVGSQEYLKEVYGLSVDSILKTIVEVYDGNRRKRNKKKSFL
ncbi:MAG: hypothetical protein NC831_02220 [Candidatus Omnitrophica bacterium]|nr:hypothetical protein [Candidatus Omnitrophota bacterium]MCM8827891.1 hypothetical protein [Candidatus Omnitrophota bacterium]